MIICGSENGQTATHLCRCTRPKGHVATPHSCPVCLTSWPVACPVCVANEQPWAPCDLHADPHAECRRIAEGIQERHAAELNHAHSQATCDTRFAQAVTRLVLPGITRKTVRVDDLRDLHRTIYGEPK